MKILKGIVVVIVVLLGVVLVLNYPKLTIISGYAAKNMASSVYVAKRSAASIVENDNNVPLISLAKTKFNKGYKSASATVFGLSKRTSFCRDGLGCALQVAEQPKMANLVPKRTRVENTLPFPYGNNGTKDTLINEVDYKKIERAIDYAFEDPENRRTRSVLIVYKDQIIGEQYVEGIDAHTPILGWSMTKSVLATLYGILEFKGALKVSDYAAINAWQNDERKAITLNHLLRMQSGLAWDEDYGSISDVNKMLFLDADMTERQEAKELVAAPKSIWNYSSGTSNLLSGILRDQFQSHQAYLDFPYSALIDKIGMHSMLLETDVAGNFVGSSYGWASTRDWAKFGLLYLHKGKWNGVSLFSPSWVNYVTQPTQNSEGTYGAHFWLNAEGKYPDVPRDLFSANGHQGQRVFIIPSKNLVVVRTGLAGGATFDTNMFLKQIIDALPREL